MSKIRVYELAKELGVENKSIISKATELNISGIKSHSNSLHADEADQIRRAFIRQAIGSRPDKETIKTKVDRSTGESRTIVEKRSGNVIRRRKQSAAEKEAEEQQVIDSAETTKTDEPELSPDDLFEDSSTTSAATETNKAAATVSHSSESLATMTETESTDQARQEQVVADESLVEQKTESQEEKPKSGPRVLGKIELPQAAAPKKSFKKKSTVRSTAVSEDIFEDDDEIAKRKAKEAKKRTKKREFSLDDLVDYDGHAARKGGRVTRGGKRSKRRDAQQSGDDSSPEITTPKASKRIVRMDEMITVGDLANQMSLKSSEVIAQLMQLGVMATINQVIDQDTATIVAEEFQFTVESTSFDEGEIIQEVEQDVPENLKPRSPVVTVMGHVDHGKTSLLDSIRTTTVAEKEHGGITQHIGAYQVKLPDERAITFIDTPGHAAFTSMRARGAHVTDIVILVVAADDGVMPQTLEAISHAKAAEVPIVVAVNKMDKPGANPDKVRQQLAERGLQPEDWGGDVMFFPVSALKGDGIQELLEGVLLQAEMKELKANPDKRAQGTIIEARQDKGLGVVATVLVQSGTLRIGDIFVSGAESGRVRSMTDERGVKIEAAGPSSPVEITGLSGVPEAGDDFAVVESENKAKQVSQYRGEKKRIRDSSALAGGPISLEEFSRRATQVESADLNLIVKADVHGSLEAVKEAVEGASIEKVRVQVIHGGVGAVNESDIQLAIASSALVVGFNVRAEPRAMNEAERHNVEVRFYRIIYELVDHVKQAMAGLLAPIKKEKSLGKVDVRETFSVPKLGRIAGGYVTEGMVKRGSLARLLRDNLVVYEGKLGSLRRFKDDVKEVQSGYECGVSIEGFQDVKTGDVIEVFEIEEIAATLDS